MTGPDRRAVDRTIIRLSTEHRLPDIADEMQKLVFEIDKLEDDNAKLRERASKQVLELAAERDQLRPARADRSDRRSRRSGRRAREVDAGWCAMTAPITPVRCACGWRGTLRTCAACPGCRREDGRLTKERLAVLHALAIGKRPAMPPNMRTWLVRRGLIVATGPAPKPSPAGRCARFPGRPFAITAAGLRVIAEPGNEERAAACAP